jgi:hypothetical protein
VVAAGGTEVVVAAAIDWVVFIRKEVVDESDEVVEFSPTDAQAAKATIAATAPATRILIRLSTPGPSGN